LVIISWIPAHLFEPLDAIISSMRGTQSFKSISCMLIFNLLRFFSPLFPINQRLFPLLLKDLLYLILFSYISLRVSSLGRVLVFKMANNHLLMGLFFISSASFLTFNFLFFLPEG
jgi:hypothetical protein